MKREEFAPGQIITDPRVLRRRMERAAVDDEDAGELGPSLRVVVHEQTGDYHRTIEAEAPTPELLRAALLEAEASAERLNGSRDDAA